jgi:hypothetical protein
LEIDGRIGILYGQKPSHTLDDHRSLALFGVACPFGPPSLFEIPQRESLFKSKYRLTLEPVSLDPRYSSSLTKHLFLSSFASEEN